MLTATYCCDLAYRKGREKAITIAVIIALLSATVGFWAGKTFSPPKVFLRCKQPKGYYTVEYL